MNVQAIDHTRDRMQQQTDIPLYTVILGAILQLSSIAFYLHFSEPVLSVNIPTSPGPYSSGHELTLTCNVTVGDPTPTVKWYRNDLLAANGTSFTFSVPADDHGSIYKCSAINIVGTANTSITLISERNLNLVSCFCL